MDAWTTADLTWLRPLEADRVPTPRTEPVTSFGQECLTLGMELDRAFEPLHRLGEELLARIAPPNEDASARMA